MVLCTDSSRMGKAAMLCIPAIVLLRLLQERVWWSSVPREDPATLKYSIKKTASALASGFPGIFQPGELVYVKP